jgi:hypothetical protein
MVNIMICNYMYLIYIFFGMTIIFKYIYIGYTIFIKKQTVNLKTKAFKIYNLVLLIVIVLSILCYSGIFK